MGPTWGPSGADRTLLSGLYFNMLRAWQHIVHFSMREKNMANSYCELCLKVTLHYNSETLKL